MHLASEIINKKSDSQIFLSLGNLGQIEELSKWDSGHEQVGIIIQCIYAWSIKWKLAPFRWVEHPLSPSPFWWVMPSTFLSQGSFGDLSLTEQSNKPLCRLRGSLFRNAFVVICILQKNSQASHMQKWKIKIVAGVTGSNFWI